MLKTAKATEARLNKNFMETNLLRPAAFDSHCRLHATRGKPSVWTPAGWKKV